MNGERGPANLTLPGCLATGLGRQKTAFEGQYLSVRVMEIGEREKSGVRANGPGRLLGFDNCGQPDNPAGLAQCRETRGA